MDKALTVAYAVVALELVLIAWIRRRFLQVSLVQVTLGGALVAAVGVLIGSS